MNLDNPGFSNSQKQYRDILNYPQTKPTSLQPSNNSNESNANQRLSPQYMDQSNRPERPKTLRTLPVRKTVSMENNQITNSIPIGHARSKEFVDDSITKRTVDTTEQKDNIANGFASKQASAGVLSPFDEQEEWAKISEIMAAFGSDLLTVSGSNNELKPNRTRLRASISSTKSLGSPIDPPPTPLSLLTDWLYENELEELEKILINNGYDDYYFINGILHEEDIELIGIPVTLRGKLIKAINSLPPAKPIIENNNDNSNISISQWLHDIRLDEYAELLQRHLILDMDRICRIWEIELQTVVEIHKIGHRKRMLNSVGLPISKKKDDKKNNIFMQGANGESKNTSNKKDDLSLKPNDQNNQTNGHKMSYGKNRPAPQPPSLSTNLEIRDPSELLLGVPTGLQTQWRHTAAKLVSSSVRYENVNYLGSTLVKELRGTESTRKSIQKLKRGERMVPPFTTASHNINGHISGSHDSHRPIILSISHRGVQFFETNTQGTICEHEIRNIDCACQDADDLTHFAYITKDLDFNQHYCHVFNAESMDLATEIILTLGQAFEVAYQLALRDATASTTPIRSPQTTISKTSGFMK